jgi:hypothetical protein
VEPLIIGLPMVLNIRLSTTFILVIINIYTTGIIQSLQAFYYVHETRMDMYTIIPLAFFLPLLPLLPCLVPFNLLGTLLVVTGSVHLVPRLLVN